MTTETVTRLAAVTLAIVLIACGGAAPEDYTPPAEWQEVSAAPAEVPAPAPAEVPAPAPAEVPAPDGPATRQTAPLVASEPADNAQPAEAPEEPESAPLEEPTPEEPTPEEPPGPPAPSVTYIRCDTPTACEQCLPYAEQVSAQLGSPHECLPTYDEEEPAPAPEVLVCVDRIDCRDCEADHPEEWITCDYDACNTDSDCGFGLECREGACKTRLLTDGELCDYGEQCQPDLVCQSTRRSGGGWWEPRCSSPLLDGELQPHWAP